jgi:hypothetical protein
MKWLHPTVAWPPVEMLLPMYLRPSRLPIHARALGVADGLIDALASRRPMWRAAMLLCLVASVPSPPRVGWAGNRGERLQDELWLVSSRQCCSVSPGVAPELIAQRYDRDSDWQPADIRELYQPTTPDQVVVIYIHGNRVPSEMAAPEGQHVYRLLTAGVDDATPIRFVIWSWPSAQVQGQLRDVRTKADRTELAGYCLAWLLTHLPESQHVSLLGYSFGARIATGAMHLVGGGELSGRRLPPHAVRSENTRVVMLAGALHNSWLRPGGYHERAISHLDYLLNLYNGCDSVLKRYHMLYKHSHATAIGYSGMYTGDLGEVAQRIEQQDVYGAGQDSHEAIHYLENPCVIQRIRDVLFWRPVRATPSSTSRQGNRP